MSGKTTVFGTGVAGGDVTLPITPDTVGTGVEEAEFDSVEANTGEFTVLVVPAGGISNILSAHGTVTVNGATPVDIADAGATANSLYIFTLKTVGGTQGAYPTCVVTPGTGAAVSATALDTSTYNWGRIG